MDNQTSPQGKTSFYDAVPSYNVYIVTCNYSFLHVHGNYNFNDYDVFTIKACQDKKFK